MSLPDTLSKLPTDPNTGLTRPLSKSLGSQDLLKHRAMLAVELEVMAKKMDRFGWERDRGTAAHDRIMTDWMDALHDYPLSEVKAACREWVKTNPRKMPNEGDIVGMIQKARRRSVEAFKAARPPEPEKAAPRVSGDRAAEIMREAGYSPRRMPQ